MGVGFGILVFLGFLNAALRTRVGKTGWYSCLRECAETCGEDVGALCETQSILEKGKVASAGIRSGACLLAGSRKGILAVPLSGTGNLLSCPFRCP